LGLTTLTDIWTSLDGGFTWAQLSSTGGRDRPAVAFDFTGFLHVVSGKLVIGEGYEAGSYPADSYVSSLSFTSISNWIRTLPGLNGFSVPTNLGLRSPILPIPSSSSSSSTFRSSTAATSSGVTGSPSSSDSSSIGTGAIVGIVIGGFFGLLLIAFIICFFCCGLSSMLRSKKKKRSDSADANYNHPPGSFVDAEDTADREVEMEQQSKK